MALSPFDTGLERGARRGALTTRSAAPLAGRCCGHWVVALAADHDLPGDARRLVGESHRGKLGRLALQEVGQPGRGRGAPAPDLLEICGRSGDKHAAQCLVASAGDAAEL